MHPAFSVIFLTTLIGAAQGLFLALFTVQSYAAFGLLPGHPNVSFYVTGSVVSVALAIAGLIASFFHLGHPERAWRSAAKWRTSWLSREVILLPAFMGIVALYGAAHAFELRPVLLRLPSGQPVDASDLLGIFGTALAFALFIATGMIYACIRFLREWASPLTVLNYVLLGGASGFTLAAALAAARAADLVGFLAGWAIIITVLAAMGRVASLLRNDRLKPTSTLQTAIGIKHPQIVQKAQGFMGGAFNTREFCHGRPIAFLRTVRGFFLVATFGLPVMLLAAGLDGSLVVLALAFVVQYAGLIAERWYFFAQANHPQNLYYQSMA